MTESDSSDWSMGANDGDNLIFNPSNFGARPKTIQPTPRVMAKDTVNSEKRERAGNVQKKVAEFVPSSTKHEKRGGEFENQKKLPDITSIPVKSTNLEKVENQKKLADNTSTSTKSLPERENDLAKRESELAKRESELAKLEGELVRQGQHLEKMVGDAKASMKQAKEKLATCYEDISRKKGIISGIRHQAKKHYSLLRKGVEGVSDAKGAAIHLDQEQIAALLTQDLVPPCLQRVEDAVQAQDEALERLVELKKLAQLFTRE